VSLIGLGPGDPSYLAQKAEKMLREAEVVAGYKTYLRLMPEELLKGKETISTGMKSEIERCERAIDAALAGRSVAVVCSGDPGIYAMAGLVFELLEQRGLLGSLPVEVVPGIPAFCAAAALLGAPLMHDFASVSLSDLLTPWEAIERRIRAAAEADFVIVLSNPRSKQRSWQLERAVEILLERRAPSTPVGVVRNASREGESVWLTTLSELDTQQVDMLCTLIIGSSRTRALGSSMVTPRGYLDKYNGAGHDVQQERAGLMPR
jgi:precorrin-3B C17-methyltransferase